MKRFILLCLSAFLTASLQAQDLSGHWRGLLNIAPEVSIVLGFELKPEGEGYQLLLSSPNQGMSGREPSSFQLEANQLQFKDDALNASFNGTFDGDTLTGVFSQRRDIPITLTRLSAEAGARLHNEQQWFGDLQVSKTASLPLVLNIAVLASGYHVTLDSPKQQSFGIPVNEFELTTDSLSFKSALIHASYQASWQQDAWHGTFVQGMAMPLVLKKKR